MSRLILHRAFGSPPARAVLMLTDMLGLKPEIKEVNILLEEHRTPEFKKMNPMCTVPVLQDGDFVLSESHAIMKYIADTYGGDKRELLHPREGRTRAVLDQCLFFDAGVFFATLLSVARDTFSGSISAPTAAQVQNIEASYTVLEAYLQQRRYIAAEHLTIADLSAGSTANAIQVMHKLNTDKFPRTADWMSRLQEEEQFKTIMAPGAAFFAKLMTKGWENNKLKNKQSNVFVCDVNMAPILYKLDGSPPACAVRMLANIIGLELELKDLNWATLEHKSPEYVKLNPLGTLPVLQDGDTVLSDSHAIMIYLLSKYGGPESLYPTDLNDRARVHQALFFDTGIFFIRLKVVAIPTLFDGLPGPTPKHLADIEEAYSFVEAYLNKHTYIAGDHLTIADLSLGASAAGMQAMLPLDKDKYPRTAEWLSKLRQEPFFNVAQQGADILTKTVQFFWQKNSQKYIKMAPILYKTEHSPPANVVRMLADIIGLPLELKEIDFLGMEHKSPEYLKLNPIGAFPTLIDGDFVLSDSHAIVKYLLTKYGGDKAETLYPSDLRTRALVDQALFFDAGVLFVRIKHVALPTIFEGLPGPLEKTIKEIDSGYSVLEAYLQKRKYVAADHLTIADLSLGATVLSLQSSLALDAKKYPRTFDWLSRLEKESFFQKYAVPGGKALGEVLQTYWEQNKKK
ncbi:uncharacterized protein LOC142987865 [Anticarsia gemmatalis]|uniref:uncharacterized protein LOC142987865 n=1 Tax=Anticarsia gemmatalis TaxID=129554 RepID=UPI003F76EA6E